MSKRSRKLEESLNLHALQLLTARRFDLYASIAPLLADVEEAVDEKNVRRIIETFARVHRRMRESLAYLNRPIFRALRGMEEAMEGGDDATGGLDLERFRIALLKLHGEMGKALRTPEFESVEDILEVGAGVRARLLHEIGPGKSTDINRRMEEALERSGRAWKLMGDRKYAAAAKQFRKALSLIPGEPKLHTDLGHALLLSGDSTGAVAELTMAVDRYATSPDEPASRRRATRILGRARRTLSEEWFKNRQIQEAIGGMKTALEELRGSLNGENDETEKETVQSEMEAAQERLSQWEEIWAKIELG